MRWTMPIFALALAIALGALSPPPAQHGQARPLPSVSLVNLSLFSSAEATTLDAARTGCAAQPAGLAASKPAPSHALLWAASLRGWAEAPTVQAWRQFVAWTKGWRPAAPCPIAQAALG